MSTTTHYPAAPAAQTVESRTLSVIVDNEPGVLARVIGLFSGRGYNIDSLTVSETEHEKHLSRITVVTRGTPMVIEQIKHQLERLVPVHRVVDMTIAGPHLERELAMVKVRGTDDDRVEALPDFVKLAEAYHAHGIRCEHPGQLDEKIREMIEIQKPVIFDCVVDPNENCFPMIPSGRAHNEMLLGDAAVKIEDAVTEEGKVMV